MCQDSKINVFLVLNTPFKYTTTGTTTGVTGSFALFLFTCEAEKQLIEAEDHYIPMTDTKIN